MTSSRPPRLALAILRFTDEALAGDLVEEFRRGRTRRWLWGQVFRALAQGPWRETGPVSLGSYLPPRYRTAPADSGLRMLDPATMNLSGIKVKGIGGLGLIAMVVLVTLTMPAAWWLAAMGLAGGIILGVLLVIRRRRIGLSSSDGGGPLSLFAPAASAKAADEPAPRGAGDRAVRQSCPPVVRLAVTR